MPLSQLQSDILNVLANRRNPEAYQVIAAAREPSGQKNAFFGRTNKQTAFSDAELLVASGFSVEWLSHKPPIHAALLRRGDQNTRLEWISNSDLRFFRAVRDEVFGYRLHAFDLATHIASAAVSRHDPRDIIALLHVHDRHLQLGAVIWAALARDKGRSARHLINALRDCACQWDNDDYARAASTQSGERSDIVRRWLQAIDEAESFVAAMPVDKEGLAFFKNDKLVQPDPKSLESYIEHSITRRGHWPSSPDIENSMLYSS